MKLKIWRVLEETIQYREADETKRGLMAITRVRPEPAELAAIKIKDVIDYRVRIGAQAKVDSGSPQAYVYARERVTQMLAREILGDLAAAIMDTEEWAFTEGYDDELCQRLRRLTALALGKDVDWPEQKAPEA